jgi:hypothetical protein
MQIRRTIAPLALIAGVALASPALTTSALAAPAATPPTAKAAGGDPVPLTPAIVNVPITRTQKALTKAADKLDAGDATRATRSLTAARRYLTRSSAGARYLVANAPPPVAEEASASFRKYRVLAHRAVSASKQSHTNGGWVRARLAGDVVGPTIADPPTAVFSVFTSEYNAATATTGMLGDARGTAATAVSTTLARVTALRGQLVAFIRTSAPPADPEAEVPEGVTTFDMVMPGVSILLGDEITQLKAAAADTTLPAAARTAVNAALAADQALVTTINTAWPPATEA